MLVLFRLHAGDRRRRRIAARKVANVTEGGRWHGPSPVRPQPGPPERTLGCEQLTGRVDSPETASISGHTQDGHRGARSIPCCGVPGCEEPMQPKDAWPGTRELGYV